MNQQVGQQGNVILKRSIGQFYTPLIWAETARKFLDCRIPGWRQGLVWDCCCGTGRLFQGAENTFTSLYATTLQPEEAAQCPALPHPVGVYDFLSDAPVPPEIDFALKEAAAEKIPVTFFMNPPYGTNGGGSPAISSRKSNKNNGVKLQTPVAKIMKSEAGVGGYQFTTQFLFQIQRLSERYGIYARIATFMKCAWLVSGNANFIKFRKWFFFEVSLYRRVRISRRRVQRDEVDMGRAFRALYSRGRASGDFERGRRAGQGGFRCFTKLPYKVSVFL